MPARISRSNRGLRRVAAGLGAAVCLAMLPAMAAGAAGSNSKPAVGLSIKGTAAKPTLTVIGSGFGASAPAADPSSHPNGVEACPSYPPGKKQAKEIKDDGYDYGSSFSAQDANNSGASSASWRAGVGEGSTETDCIGLRITKWSNTKVVFKMGTAYDNPSLEGGSSYVFGDGDVVTVNIEGQSFSTCFGSCSAED